MVGWWGMSACWPGTCTSSPDCIQGSKCVAGYCSFEPRVYYINTSRSVRACAHYTTHCTHTYHLHLTSQISIHKMPQYNVCQSFPSLPSYTSLIPSDHPRKGCVQRRPREGQAARQGPGRRDRESFLVPISTRSILTPSQVSEFTLIKGFT
jgi:hypothetical protein